jgi:phosphohistidine phosphatase
LKFFCSSAAKEALEEAGVKGGVHGKLLGIYRHRKLGKTCTVKVYPMRVTRVYKTWPEIDRDREWLPLKKALKRVHNDSLRQVLRKLPATL